MRHLWFLSFGLCVAACLPTKKPIDDSTLTDVEIEVPDPQLFPAASPDGKIKKLMVVLTPVKSEEDRYVCKDLTETIKDLPYSTDQKGTLNFQLLQACSYSFTMKLVGADDADVYYQGQSQVTTAQLQGQKSYRLEIALNLTEKGAAAGFGKLTKKEDATTVKNSSGQGGETQLTLASQLGKDSCNVTSWFSVDREATVSQSDARDERKLNFLSALRLLPSPPRAEINKALAKVCGDSFASYTVRCEISINIKTESFAGIYQENLKRRLTTAAFPLLDRWEIRENFALKSPYEQAESTIELVYCLAKKP